MSDPIWKKHAKQAGPDAAVMEFLAGQDVVLDRELITHDIRASKAHARGLATIGLLSREETAHLENALDDIAERLASGQLVLGAEFEDGHSAIEHWLTEMLGPLGGKIHTGRSRNDQVAVALRLYMKDRLAELRSHCCAVAQRLLGRAVDEGGLPMPGYTHLQRAMPSSAGLWLAGHAEAFIDNAELAQVVGDWLDASPLGTASGFGVNLPLAREEAARALGFKRLVLNPQAAQNARGKIELQAIGALGAATLDLRRLAWDLSLFTSEAFGFIELPDRYCTGSSIMPNKRNPDVVELMRAIHAVVVGAQAELESVLSLPSGYQRDLQATKSPLLRAFTHGLQALALLPDLLGAFSWNAERLRAAISPDMLATDLAIQLAQEGRPFREAYREAAARIQDPGDEGVEQSLAARVSAGACANLCLDQLRARLERLTGHEQAL